MCSFAADCTASLAALNATTAAYQPFQRSMICRSFQHPYMQYASWALQDEQPTSQLSVQSAPRVYSTSAYVLPGIENFGHHVRMRCSECSEAVPLHCLKVAADRLSATLDYVDKKTSLLLSGEKGKSKNGFCNMKRVLRSLRIEHIRWENLVNAIHEKCVSFEVFFSRLI